MSGAYVAKPELIPEVDYPPEWNVDWAHPGPWPPGYEPELTIVSDGPATYSAGASANIVSTLYDHDSYKTTDPGDSVTYTATLNGAALQLRFAGGSWASTISRSFGDLGSGFFGNDEDIQFNIGPEDGGKTIAITAASTPFGFSVSDSVSMTVAEYNLATSAIASEMIYYNNDSGDGKLRLVLNVVGMPGWDSENLGPTTWVVKVGGVAVSSGTLAYNWPNGVNVNPAFESVIDVDVDEADRGIGNVVLYYETEGSIFGEQSVSVECFNDLNLKATLECTGVSDEYTSVHMEAYTAGDTNTWDGIWNPTSGSWSLDADTAYTTAVQDGNTVTLAVDTTADASRATIGITSPNPGYAVSGEWEIFAKGSGDIFYLVETRAHSISALSEYARYEINDVNYENAIWETNG